jgi:hypothetical protein
VSDYPELRDKDKEVTWLTQVLLDAIGARILSRLCGADPLGAYGWVDAWDPGPDAAQAARVRVAYDVWKMLERHGDDFVRDWLLTANPVVGDRPADALARDEFAAVMQAAQFVRDADRLEYDATEDEDDGEV